MQFQDVPVFEVVVGSDMLAVIGAWSPKSREFQSLGDVAVDQLGDLADRPSLANRVRLVHVSGFARQLGVHPDDAEIVEEPGRQLFQALSRCRRYRQPWVMQIGEVFEDIEFRSYVFQLVASCSRPEASERGS